MCKLLECGLQVFGCSSNGRRYWLLLRAYLHMRSNLRLPARVRLPRRGAIQPRVLMDTSASCYAGVVASDLRREPADADAGSKQPTERAAVLLRRLTLARPRWLSFLRGRLRSEADADDVLQQSLMRAGEKLHTLADEKRLEGWFFRILRRKVADHCARWALRESRLEALTDEVAIDAPEEAATCACSLGLMPALRPEYAEMLRRVDLEDESLATVATSLGLSVNNATVRLHRARRALRTRLLEACHTSSIRTCLDCECEA